MKFSVIIPVHNEEDNISALYKSIVSSVSKVSKDFNDFEIIIINDGSTDQSKEIINNIKPNKAIHFKKRFGQTAALDAGFAHASGDYVITIDGDGQNDPNDISNLFSYLNENNLDCVCGWRQNRKDVLSKRLASKLAFLIRKIIAGDTIHDSGCTLKIYKKECLKTLELYGEMHRFIPALLVTKGFSVGEVPVKHFERKYGKSKYGISRGIKGLLDLAGVLFWRRYVNRPLHLFGTIGIIIFIISSLTFSFLLYQKIFLDIDLSETIVTDLSLFGFIVGIQFVAFGLLADMLSKIYFSQEGHSSYTIDSIEEDEK